MFARVFSRSLGSRVIGFHNATANLPGLAVATSQYHSGAHSVGSLVSNLVEAVNANRGNAGTFAMPAPWKGSRSFAADAVGSSDLPAAQAALKNPTANIQYDESVHQRFRAGDESKRAFSYFVLSGGRFVYASALRLMVLKLVLSMTATKDVLALASLEVGLGAIPVGNTITVKWRGKPVFIRHRSDEEVAEAKTVNVAELRDPQTDDERVQNPSWLVVVGVCTHLGCVPLPNAGDYHGWFCPCHGSHYDTSGRIRKGPAPYNLEVPEYKFLDDDKVLIG